MSHRRHTVAVVAFDAVQLLDVTGPVEVFTTANRYGAHYDVRVVSPTGANVVTSSGLALGVNGPLSSLPRRIGTLVVPGRRDWRAAVGDTDLVESVADLAGRAVRVSSVCAGAFVLAATGLLDGRRAATHWELAPDLAVAFPEVRVESDPVFVRDGHVVTSAGVTAGIDLALSLVEEDCGAEAARSVARQLVVFMARPGGQAQFSARMVPGRPRHSAVRHVMDHVGSDPSAAHTLDSLAAVGGVSVRHLARLFRSEIGMSPGQYVDSIRTEAAQALLENGDGTVEEVAQQAGFGSSESLRRVFQHTLGVSPTEYRARFRSTAVSRRIVAA
ncbi:GlxA family transcriptional regulator [Streptomyces doebereineriae]|uniref:GlxA family transcriptional regulator n=1 Tax=Streptomyces doebereineriae TaxID=3075528 RepID=A0ABU2V1G6_9ACTN|nr:GlxA family transcriptional regulator [Streptomyces sp. DSM 41640]MDT0479405.1 GlxA family transcriptional regulator [Streptomyces sp. DSM 41640]